MGSENGFIQQPRNDEYPEDASELERSGLVSQSEFDHSTWIPQTFHFKEFTPMAFDKQKDVCRPINVPSILCKLTVHLEETFRECNPGFEYSGIQNPKCQIPLTKPSQGVSNNGFDNVNSDLILTVNGVLVNSEAHRRYTIKEMLGQGTFGQVAKCWKDDTHEYVAVKVIKNQPAYYHQALVEIGILRMLNGKYDPDDKHHIVRLVDHFVYQQHLCIAFELLSHNLFELIKQNQFQGLSINLVRLFTKQLLDSLTILQDSKVIHCDLKPENILLKSLGGEIKLIDFGSACLENRTVYSYIQSRFYRSPEVLLGHAYTTSIDMWSLGCVSAELFLGLPLFPGASEYDLMHRMLETLGCQPPDHVLSRSKQTKRFFKKLLSKDEGSSYAFLTPHEFEEKEKTKPIAGKRYFKHHLLEDIVLSYSLTKGIPTEEAKQEREARLSFVHFLKGLVDFDPVARWTPWQASRHPFITEEPFSGQWDPPEDPCKAKQELLSTQKVAVDKRAAATTSPSSIPSHATYNLQNFHTNAKPNPNSSSNSFSAEPSPFLHSPHMQPPLPMPTLIHNVYATHNPYQAQCGYPAPPLAVTSATSASSFLPSASSHPNPRSPYSHHLASSYGTSYGSYGGEPMMSAGSYSNANSSSNINVNGNFSGNGNVGGHGMMNNGNGGPTGSYGATDPFLSYSHGSHNSLAAAMAAHANSMAAMAVAAGYAAATTPPSQSHVPPHGSHGMGMLPPQNNRLVSMLSATPHTIGGMMGGDGGRGLSMGGSGALGVSPSVYNAGGFRAGSLGMSPSQSFFTPPPYSSASSATAAASASAAQFHQGSPVRHGGVGPASSSLGKAAAVGNYKQRRAKGFQGVGMESPGGSGFREDPGAAEVQPMQTGLGTALGSGSGQLSPVESPAGGEADERSPPPDPRDWDPGYSDELLLDDDPSEAPQAQPRQAPPANLPPHNSPMSASAAAASMAVPSQAGSQWGRADPHTHSRLDWNSPPSSSSHHYTTTTTTINNSNSSSSSSHGHPSPSTSQPLTGSPAVLTSYRARRQQQLQLQQQQQQQQQQQVYLQQQFLQQQQRQYYLPPVAQPGGPYPSIPANFNNFNNQQQQQPQHPQLNSAAVPLEGEGEQRRRRKVGSGSGELRAGAMAFSMSPPEHVAMQQQQQQQQQQAWTPQTAAAAGGGGVGGGGSGELGLGLSPDGRGQGSGPRRSQYGVAAANGRLPPAAPIRREGWR